MRGRIDDVLKYTPDTEGWHSVTGLGFFLQEIPGVSEGISESMLDRTVFLIEWSKATYVTYGLIAQPTTDELVRVAEESFFDDILIHYESQGVTTEEDLGYTTSSWDLFESMHMDIEGVYALWPLNQSSGTNVPDISGYERDGTTSNMEDADWVSGKLDNCLIFDGVNELVNCGDIANFERTDPFSIEFWFRTSTSSVTQAFISRALSTGNLTGWYVTHFSGFLFFNLRNTSTNWLQVRTSTGGYNDNAWHHAVITYSGNSLPSGVIFYVDNTVISNLITSNTLSASIQNSANCEMAHGGGVGYYNGYLDEVVIYDKVISSSDVSYRWNSGSGRLHPATLAQNTLTTTITDRTFHSSIVYV